MAKDKINILNLSFSDKLYKYHYKEHIEYHGHELSHYTNLNGLKGIIDSTGFWLSDHRFLNDEEEFNNGRNLVLNITERLIKKNRYKEFINILNKVIDKLNKHEEDAYYISSFSTKKDSLDLWKWYANADIGISIVFENTEHFHMSPIFEVSKVIYNDKVKYKIILNLIRNYNKVFLIDKQNNKFNNIETLEESCSDQLLNNIIFNLIKFKNIEFQSESELRLFISEDTRVERDFKLKHRVNNKFIPYIESSEIYKKYDSGKLPIKEIILSPNNKDETIKKSIDLYLKNMGYSNVKISFSKVPFRG